jgi:hypothetical protein
MFDIIMFQLCFLNSMSIINPWLACYVFLHIKLLVNTHQWLNANFISVCKAIFCCLCVVAHECTLMLLFPIFSFCKFSDNILGWNNTFGKKKKTHFSLRKQTHISPKFFFCVEIAKSAKFHHISLENPSCA